LKLFPVAAVYISIMKKILLLVALVLAPRAFADEPAATIVARVQKYYDATKSLRAKFDQELQSPTTGTKKASGEVLLKKPGKMRWDYVTPEKKLMVSDGATLWVYQPEDEQAVKQDLKGSTLPAQVSFLVGEGKLAQEFDASNTKLDGLPADTLALKMVPKTGTAAYRYLVFVVDGKSGQVKQTIIYDQQGGTNKLSFSDVQQNKSIDDGKFRFSPPAGTQIIKP
jgi:outer membrane lipoprotein carrier protein